MAENNKDIDVLFREKLAEYSEMPRPKAWDRIQGKLDQKNKSGFEPWIRIAASVLLLGLGLALIYYSLLSNENNPGRIAQQETVPDTRPGNILSLEVFPEMVQEEIVPQSNSTVQPAPVPVKRPLREINKAPINLVVQATEDSEEVTEENRPPMDVESRDLPALDKELLMSDGGISEEVEEVPYKITIISNGLSPRQDKDNLVKEIENKIGQLGGLLSKVDQEFADLQDSKNNLFASLTSKKENNN